MVPEEGRDSEKVSAAQLQGNFETARGVKCISDSLKWHEVPRVERKICRWEHCPIVAVHYEHGEDREAGIKYVT